MRTVGDTKEETAPPKKVAAKRSGPRWGQALSQEEQHRQRREVIFRTAARAFNEMGYHNTTLDEVAKRLNITKPTLYYYVKDKDDILTECNRLAFEHMKEAFREAEQGTISGIEKLTHFLMKYADLMVNDFGACLIRTGLQPLRPESRAKLRPMARRFDKALRAIIAQGIDEGSIRTCDPKMVSNAIFGGFSGIANWYRTEGNLKPQQIGESFLDLYIRGLLPDGKVPKKRTKG